MDEIQWLPINAASYSLALTVNKPVNHRLHLPWCILTTFLWLVGINNTLLILRFDILTI